MAAYRIIKLDNSWKGKTRLFRYRSDSYLDIQIVEERGGSRIEFCKQMFDAPIEKELEVSWMEDHMHAPQLFAAVDGDEEIVGYIELELERWNNRMRVANLFVEEPFRRTGVGTQLMEHACSVAKKAGARMMVLETQSCNMPAIRFYLSQGYAIGGLDLFHYSNEDLERHEVRIEMMRPLEG
ncbi:MAG: GNAT family N-acetyltransferase [Oscillospiraceae bacterium]|nr:GNAT family N-acetyltransferase [Oscillospiraceae bacterium]